jgi:hypothetical protein
MEPSLYETCQAVQKQSLHEDAGIVEPFTKRHRLVCQFGTDPEIAPDDMEREGIANETNAGTSRAIGRSAAAVQSIGV